MPEDLWRLSAEKSSAPLPKTVWLLNGERSHLLPRSGTTAAVGCRQAVLKRQRGLYRLHCTSSIEHHLSCSLPHRLTCSRSPHLRELGAAARTAARFHADQAAGPVCEVLEKLRPLDLPVHDFPRLHDRCNSPGRRSSQCRYPPPHYSSGSSGCLGKFILSTWARPCRWPVRIHPSLSPAHRCDAFISFLETGQARRVSDVPAHVDQHNLERGVQALQHFGYRRTQRFHCRSHHSVTFRSIPAFLIATCIGLARWATAEACPQP